MEVIIAAVADEGAPTARDIGMGKDMDWCACDTPGTASPPEEDGESELELVSVRPRMTCLFYRWGGGGEGGVESEYSIGGTTR